MPENRIAFGYLSDGSTIVVLMGLLGNPPDAMTIHQAQRSAVRKGANPDTIFYRSQSEVDADPALAEVLETYFRNMEAQLAQDA